MKKLLLTLLGVLMALPSMALDFEYTYEGQTIKYTVISETANTVEIKDRQTVIGDLILPEHPVYNGKEYTLIMIGRDAFMFCGQMTSITIPNSVTSIGSFYQCSGLISVTIGNGVKSIPKYAFQDCTGLTSVIIGNSVTSIGENAFYYCSGLRKLAYPNTISSNLLPSEILRIEYPADGAIIEDDCVWGPEKSALYFVHLNAKGEFTIPNSVTSIESYAFSGCSGLASVTIPNSVTSIGSAAFSGCSGLTSVAIPNSVTSIGSFAFSGCSGLTSVTIPNSVTSIGEYAFSGCKGLTSVTIPDSVTFIDKDAFSDCTGLTSVTIPNSVTSIGKYAFSGCTGLTKAEFASIESLCSISFANHASNPLYNAHHLYINGSEVTEVEIPETVTSIRDYTFYSCTGLTSVTIPNSVTSIGDSTFSGCSGLAEINSYCENPPTISESSFNGLYETVPVIVADNTLTNYLNTLWSQFSNLKTQSGIEATLVTDDKGLNYRKTSDNTASLVKGAYSSLTSATIPARVSIDGTLCYVTSIGYGAFKDCSKLTSVSITNSKKELEISDYAFYECTGLTSVSIPNSVTSIGESAFYHCSGLTSVTIGNGVTSIGENAFGYCSSSRLTKAEFASIESLCSIEFKNEYSNPLLYAEHLYINGSEVTEVEIPESVTSIPNYAFYDCKGLNSVTIPNSVTSIGRSAFDGCTGLTSVTISNGVTSIAERAFYYCIGLNSVTIPNSVTSIREYAFSGCSGLISVAIPNSVTKIGVSAFKDCSGLTSVTIGNGVTSIGNSAFNGCSKLERVQFNAENCTSCGSSSSSVFPTTIETVVFGENVKTVPAYAFYKCSGLYPSITIPNSVTSIGNYAFYGCSQLRKVTIGDSVTSIGDYAFYYCPKMTSVSIGNSVTSIGNYAFYDCCWLTSVTIPDSVTSIGDSAFYKCTGLTSVTIGSGVTSIGNSVFNSCSELTIAKFASIESLCSISFADAYANPLYYAKHLYIIEKEVTEVEIPETVTSIGNYSFQNCIGLTSVKIPNSVTSIGGSAFSGCYKLTSVTIPNSVTSIGSFAFSEWSRLTSITIPNSVTEIGASAFKGCAKLAEVSIADGTTPLEFGSDVFKSTAITTLHMGREFTGWTIPTSLKTLSYGNSIKEIPANALANYSNLESVTFGASIESIGENAFNGCKLTKIVLPPALQTIGNNAFASNSLKSIVIGSKVTEIGEKAFDGSNAIEQVYITASTPPAANNNTFSDYNSDLYVASKELVDTYYDTTPCWYNFENGYAMTAPESLTVTAPENTILQPGETMQLTATVAPANVTLPQVFWHSTHPDFASVDSNGLVTRHANTGSKTRAASEGNTCRIIAETLYGNGPIASVIVGDVPAMIESIFADQPTEAVYPEGIYTLQGVCIKRNATEDDVKALTPGLYIIGGKKVLIK